MKKSIAFVICILLSVLCFAQGYVNVKCNVVDVNGKPISGASVMALGTKLTFTTDNKGTIEVRIPETVNYFRVRKYGYISENVKVKPNVKAVLKIDAEVLKAEAAKAAAEKAAAAAKAAAAKAAAEKAAAEKAAAERAAAEAEAARLSAEKAARDQAIKDSLDRAAAAECQARIDAANKAVRDAENARAASEQAAGEELARLRAEKAAAEAEAARLAAENEELAARKKSEGKGFQHTVGVSYFMCDEMEINFPSGPHQVQPSPVMIDYVLGYRFSNNFTLGAGLGYFRFLEPLYTTATSNYDRDGVDLKNYQQAWLITLNTRYAFGDGNIRPFVAGSYGLNLSNSDSPMFDFGAGLEFGLSERAGLMFQVSYAELPFYIKHGGLRLKVAMSF